MRIAQFRIATFSKALLLMVAFSGCEKKPEEKSDRSSDPTLAQSGKAGPAVTTEPKSASELAMVEKVKLVALDLSSQGAQWKGWSIMAPEESKVMGDMDPASVRIAGKGCSIVEKCPYFDLILSPKKPDLKNDKKLQEQGAAKYGDKVTFSTDTPDLLEWTREGELGKSINFVRVVEVAGKRIGCRPLAAMVAESNRTAMKEACASLVKK